MLIDGQENEHEEMGKVAAVDDEMIPQSVLAISCNTPNGSSNVIDGEPALAP